MDPHSSLGDHELLRLTACGDSSAFECLVKRHQSTAWALACRFLGDPDAARDMVQEAFIRILQAAPRYQPSAEFRAYLTRIVGRLCLDYSRRKRPLILPELPDMEDPSASPLETILTGERDNAIRNALAKLPPNQRLAVILKYYHELSYLEIAEVMKTSEKAVERLLARGRVNLASLLANWIEG